MTMLDMEKGAKLDMLLEKNGVTQSDVASVLGISQSRISEWKHNQWRMPIEVGVRLAKALGVTAEYLCDDNQDDPPSLLNEDERLILTLARDLGYEEARRRLIAVPRQGKATGSGADEIIRSGPSVESTPLRKGG